MLANPEDAIVLADGTKIDPISGEVVKQRNDYIEVPSNSEAQRIVTRVNRSIVDLPAPPKHMNFISVVMMYQLMGLNNKDIAIAANCTIEQVENVQTLGVFKECFDIVRDAVLANDSESIQALFAQRSRAAADTVHDIMKDTDVDEKVRLNAAKDILDRGGFRPADVIDHRHSFENQMRIEYIEKDSMSNVPTIEGEFEHVG